MTPLKRAIEQRWRWIVVSGGAVVVGLVLGDSHEVARESGAAFCVGLVMGALWVLHLICDARTGRQWSFLYLVLPIIVLQGTRDVSDLATLAGWAGLGIWLLATMGAFLLAVFALIVIFHRRVEVSVKNAVDYHA